MCSRRRIDIDQMRGSGNVTGDDIRDELTALAVRDESEFARADRLARTLVEEYGYAPEAARDKALATVYLDRYRDQVRADAVLAEIENGAMYRG